MKRWILILLSVLFLTSCIGPFKRNKNAITAVGNTKKDISKKEDSLSEKSKAYVFAADFSLGLETNFSIFSSTAKDFTGRSLLITGNPSTEEALALKKIVYDLTSTNELLITEGKKNLAAKDKEVIGLEKQVNVLNDKLEKKEEKFKEIANENSILANKWSRMWFWIKMVTFVLVGGFILSVISSILPPPYNSIVALVAMPIGIITRFFIGAIPKVGEFAHTVSKTTYDKSQLVSKDLVEVIQQIWVEY